ncbi:MAG TPA: hypothetical protein VJ204_10025 [Solirubrobacterales bacterium]|nr:hypothetical protein [Solirubrobacterales bacterium]
MVDREDGERGVEGVVLEGEVVGGASIAGGSAASRFARISAEGSTAITSRSVGS